MGGGARPGTDNFGRRARWVNASLHDHMRTAVFPLILQSSIQQSSFEGANSSRGVYGRKALNHPSCLTG